jgi:large subunit ribosomal protein L24
MKIKKGDTIKVKAGKDKGKTGKVLQSLPGLNRVSVEGVNVLVKHLRSNKDGQEGQKIEFPSPIHVSNVSLVCSHCGKVTRIQHQRSEGEPQKKVRTCAKCKTAI